MAYLLFGGAALVGVLVLYRLIRHVPLGRLLAMARWLAGGVLALLTAFLLLRGQAGIAGFTGFAAYSVLKLGRLGPIDFTGFGDDIGDESEVHSRFFAMRLDHDTGDVAGRVIAGRFAGSDLMTLGEAETRQLLDEVGGDPDSLALLETWLDRNRTGWREYFAGRDGAAEPGVAGDPDEEAYEILGLRPGATAEEIRAAHRALMKAVHPDQGGSTYLAAKINQAKDRLLKRAAEK